MGQKKEIAYEEYRYKAESIQQVIVGIWDKYLNDDSLREQVFGTRDELDPQMKKVIEKIEAEKTLTIA